MKEDVARFNHQIGTDRPLISQYFTSIRRVFTLDFGNSYQSGAPVKKIIVPALFRSGKLALLAFVITIPISIAAGIFAARRQGQGGRPGRCQHRLGHVVDPRLRDGSGADVDLLRALEAWPCVRRSTDRARR